MLTKPIRECSEALLAFSQWRSSLTADRIDKFERSTLSKDGDLWCILSGPDLTWDRSGFGNTISEAVADFVSVYLDTH